MSALPKTVLIVTDAWHPQINGVVRSIERVGEEMTRRGMEVKFLTPLEFKTLPMPGYDEIRLSRTSAGPVHSRIEAAGADAIHIATEGPLGLIARNYCTRRRDPVLDGLSHAVPRVPAGPAAGAAGLVVPLHALVPCAGPPLPGRHAASEEAAGRQGFANVAIWSKGVDTALSARPGG